MILYTVTSNKIQTNRLPSEGPFENEFIKRFEFSKFWNPEKLVEEPREVKQTSQGDSEKPGERSRGVPLIIRGHSNTRERHPTININQVCPERNAMPSFLVCSDHGKILVNYRFKSRKSGLAEARVSVYSRHHR